MRGAWQSKEAVLVVEKILRFVNLVGGHVPWSNAQRKALGSHFDADARHFGSGCFFYSAAPDDVTHALAQRMCFAHDGSGRFPAVTSVEFESAIRGKSSREQVVGSFDMRSDAMQARIELNPVASVVCFRSQLQLLNKVLGCRSLGRSTVDVRDALRDDRTQPGGFAGALYANRAVIETNQRGCQHTHGILHSAAVMAPDGLSSIVSNDLLRNSALSKLGNIWQSQLSFPWHLIAQALSRQGVPAGCMLPAKPRLPTVRIPPPPPSSSFTQPFLRREGVQRSKGQWEDLRLSGWFRQLCDLGSLVVASKNIHVCQVSEGGTCTKGVAGQTGCRYAHPWGGCGERQCNCVEVVVTPDDVPAPPIPGVEFGDSVDGMRSPLKPLKFCRNLIRCLLCYTRGALSRAFALARSSGSSGADDDKVLDCVNEALDEDKKRKLTFKVAPPSRPDPASSSLTNSICDQRALYVESARPLLPVPEVVGASQQPTHCTAAREGSEPPGTRPRSAPCDVA
jgi:hypothetical protein